MLAEASAISIMSNWTFLKLHEEGLVVVGVIVVVLVVVAVQGPPSQAAEYRNRRLKSWQNDVIAIHFKFSSSLSLIPPHPLRRRLKIWSGMADFDFLEHVQIIA